MNQETKEYWPIFLLARELPEEQFTSISRHSRTETLTAMWRRNSVNQSLLSMEEELNVSSSVSPYQLLLNAVLLIPISHYLLLFLFVFLVFLYNLFEIHFLRDMFTVFRGQSVSLMYDSSSHVYREVVSRCKILHSR